MIRNHRNWDAFACISHMSEYDFKEPVFVFSFEKEGPRPCCLKRYQKYLKTTL